MQILRRGSLSSRDSRESGGDKRRLSVMSKESIRSRESTNSKPSSRDTDNSKSVKREWRNPLSIFTSKNEDDQGTPSPPVCRSPSLTSAITNCKEDASEDMRDFSDRRKFADLVAERVTLQLRTTIKSSVTSVVGQAIDAAIAERLLLASCGLPLGHVCKGFAQAGSNPTSEDTSSGVCNHRVPTNGSLVLAEKNFEATSTNNSIASSFSSEMIACKDPSEKMKKGGMRRRNSIGTMERMLADNLFSTNVFQDKHIKHHKQATGSFVSDKAESSRANSRRDDEEFSTIPTCGTQRSASRKSSRKLSRNMADLHGATKKALMTVQQEVKLQEPPAKPTVSVNISNDGEQSKDTQDQGFGSPDSSCTSAFGDKLPPKLPENEAIDAFSIVPGGIDAELPSEPVSPGKSPSIMSPGQKKKNSHGIHVDVMKSMRQVHENELMEDFISRKSQEIKAEVQLAAADSLEDSDDEREIGFLNAVASPRWLQICGILPWDHQCCFFAGQGTLAVRARLGSRTWYQLLVRVLVTLSLGFYFYEAIALTAEIDTLTTESSAQLMSDMPLALGSLLGLLFSDTLWRNNIIGSRDSLLVCFCRQEGLLARWAKHSRLAYFEVLFIWVCMVGERVRSSIAMKVDVTHTVLHVVGFAMITGVLMGLAYCLLHVCRALAIMTDSFCSGFAVRPSCPEAVRDWNVLQAVLRKVSYSVECVFLVMLTAALVAVCLPLLRHGSTDGIQSLLAVVPASLVLFSVARISFRAGAVTYKCDRVPALINSLTFGRDIDHERQYVINYILHSMAGFYVFEVRVTADMVLKFAYVSGAIVFGVLTQLLS